MRTKRLLEYDSVIKRKKTFHVLADGWAIEEKTDVTDIIEANKAQYAATDERAPYKGDVLDGNTKVASIPMVEYFALVRAGIIDPEGNCHDDTRLLRWLQDRSNLHFRTRPGRLI